MDYSISLHIAFYPFMLVMVNDYLKHFVLSLRLVVSSTLFENKKFEREMIIKTQPTILLQTYCKFIL